MLYWIASIKFPRCFHDCDAPVAVLGSCLRFSLRLFEVKTRVIWHKNIRIAPGIWSNSKFVSSCCNNDLDEQSISMETMNRDIQIKRRAELGGVSYQKMVARTATWYGNPEEFRVWRASLRGAICPIYRCRFGIVSERQTMAFSMSVEGFHYCSDPNYVDSVSSNEE